MTSVRASVGFTAIVLGLGGCGATSHPDGFAGDAGTDSGGALADAVAHSGDAAACVSDVTVGNGIALTDRGAVRGAKAGATWSYKNIPFAAPPVGPLRWKAPQPAACWSDLRDATTWGATCPQSDAAGTGPVVGDEDCLQLNVWTPEAQAGGALPVLFWIHGGGFTGGTTTENTGGVDLYDGQRLAEKTHAVVVTANYRVGVLGFLAHAALAAEVGDHGTGNYGMLDQLAALKWVQQNARAFGGDPGRVMIFGESAGGASVCMLIASPLSQGLFSSAIMESGGCKAIALDDAEAFGGRVARAAHCDGAADVGSCLRAVPAEAMVAALPVAVEVAGPTTPYGAVIDQVFLAGAPLAIIESGNHRHVPVIVGSNSDETSRTVPLKQTATETEYEAAVRALLPTVADAVLARYPASGYASPWAAYVAVTTDAKFTCGARRTVRALRKGQTEPVFRYFFTHGLDNAKAAKTFGVWHGADVLYVFDHLGVAGYTASAVEQEISDAIGAYWSRLAAQGDPNGGSDFRWPPSDDQDTYLDFAAPLAVGKGVRSDACDFWDSFAF